MGVRRAGPASLDVRTAPVADDGAQDAPKPVAATEPAAQAPKSWSPPANRKPVKNERYVDETVSIVSKAPLTPEQAGRLAQRVEAAWGADLRAEGRSPAAPGSPQVTVELISDKDMNYKGGGIADAMAIGENKILLRNHVATDAETLPDGDDTLAHELIHIIDARSIHSSSTRMPAIFGEGKAWALGLKFAVDEGKVPTGLAYTRKQTQDLKRAQVENVIRTFDWSGSEDAFVGEPLGGLYMEFLRTRLGGTGLPDAYQRLGRVMADLDGKTKFGDAFQREFNLPLAQAQSEFLDHIQRTEGKPTERFRGTLFDVDGPVSGSR